MGAWGPFSIVLLLFFCALVVQSRTIVRYLPGFNGPLPFYLETGYVMVDEINGGELFYYFIESEGNPSEDPLLIWLTGGHRCSVLCGLFFEIGPLKIVKAPYNGSIPELAYHPYAWTKNASIIFLDSPLGAGFSYSSNPKGYEVGDTITSLQIHKFLMKWFVDHPNYIPHAFYVGGDSYAGKIVPFIAQLVAEGIEAGQQPLLNLKGYLVGNPVTGEKIDGNARVPYAYGVGIISKELFELTQKSCVGEDYSNPINVGCAEVLDAVEQLMSEVGMQHILEPNCILSSSNPKDIIQNRRILKDDYILQLSQPEEPPFYCRAPIWRIHVNSLAYETDSYIHYQTYFWANDNATQTALGIRKGIVKEWQRCRESLPYEVDINSNIKYHRNLTSRGYRALIYSGDHDMAIPFLGTQAWIRSLNFPVLDSWRAWHVDGQTAGFTETYSNNLRFATIRDGGHTAPEYRPIECLAMFERWISYQHL